ncbi:MAG TPA: P27 family phage terminase small subunit [Thermoanaerobaculaceae bacterium]|nr:P27 family phage terminase small subunit [Thermoanaerobaculaceae bacterium]HPS79801.1 P27 family phage terminase small subunit [Thermoanaerobaculaceae bacterium]
MLALFQLEAHHLRVLEGACLAWDRAEEARRAVDEHGVVVADRWGQLRANPATVVERDQRALFGRLVGQLGLDVPAPGTGR